MPTVDLPCTVDFAGRAVPIIAGMDHGQPMTAEVLQARQLRPPETCGHARATWSHDVVCLCPECGQDMFLPPSLLALLPADELTAMRELWSAAGWPRWNHYRLAWEYDPQFWIIRQHPLYDRFGGIPVRHGREEIFDEVTLKFA